MSEDRTRILNMLADGRVTAEEAERLLDAQEARAGASTPSGESAIKGDPEPLIAALPKYLYVKVVATSGDNVDMKIPIALVRSGLKLLQPQARGHRRIRRDPAEMEINVDAQNGDNVRVYCK